MVRKFVIYCLLFALPVLGVMVGVNYYGDAANLFSGNYEKDISLALSKGQNVTNVLNCDERLLQKGLIENTAQCPDIVVLGSSRIMEIRSVFFGDSSFLNSGVSGASIEDILAFLEVYEQKKCKPRKIILGLDAWTLNKNNEQVRWKTLEPEYNNYLGKLGLSKYSSQNAGLVDRLKERLKVGIKLYQLISPSYFKSSYKSLLFSNKKVHVVATKVNNTFTRLPDGSVTYDSKYRSVDHTELNKRVAEFTNGAIYSIENFRELNPEAKELLEGLITYLVKQGIKVEFFLAPYHPSVFEIIEKTPRYKMVGEAEAYYLGLAKNNGIYVHGSFDPGKTGLHTVSFYDGMHCNEAAIQRILGVRQ